MSIYSEVLEKKEKNNQLLEQKADELLCTGKGFGSFENTIELTERAILLILGQFGIESVKVSGCETVEELLNAMLDPEGIMYNKIELSNGSWKQQSNFILAFNEDGTPVIISPGIIGYQCYSLSNNKKTRYKNNNLLQDKAYVIYRPMGKGKFSVFEFVKLIVRLISPEDILSVVVATALVSALGLVAPELNRFVLNNLINEGTAAYSQLIAVAFIFVVAGTLRGVISIVKTFLLGKMKLRISTQVQIAVLAKVLLMPYDYFINGSVGKQSVQIRSAKKLADTIIDFIMNNFISVVFAVVYIPQMKGIAPELVAPALLVLLVQIVMSVLLCVASAKNTAETLESRQNLDSMMYDFLKGIQKVKGVGAEKRAYSMIAARYHKVLGTTLEPPLLVRLNSTIIALVSSFGALLILIVAAIKGVSGANYIAFTSSYALITTSVTSLVSMGKIIITIKPLIDQMRQLFDYKQAVEEGRRYISSLSGKIDIEKLHFSYNKDERGCVDNISLHIDEGEKVAFVGESGCGKSTLLKLLMGVLTPNSGSILYDGVSVSSFNQRSFRKKIGSVFQFTKVFPGTVFDNIVFNSPNATEEDAWAAAEAASIADDIRKLPFGMETRISEGNGGGFSGGQKQRILLARAFAQKPSILILDEATSALDNISQHKVLSSVYKMRCTVIMVAHRLSTVKNCDRIIVFKDGKIVEEGNYDSLMQMNGEFAELARKQHIE